MPRAARQKSESKIYHVLVRGINRQTIFEDGDDASKYLSTLKRYKEEDAYMLYAYCLMGNHIHLLLKEEKEDLGIIMRRIGAAYVYWYNNKYNRCGHLFQDRYKSDAVETDQYFLAVLRYIHQNPVKAHIAEDPASYRWSSFTEYLGRASVRLVDVDFVLNMFHRDTKKALQSFKEFHRGSSEDAFLETEENKRITDESAIDIIKKICNVQHCNEVQIAEKEKRDQYLKMMKDKGLSTRQIARLTGIKRNIILKA